MARKTARKAILIELDPEYCEMISDRCRVTIGMLWGINERRERFRNEKTNHSINNGSGMLGSTCRRPLRIRNPV